MGAGGFVGGFIARACLERGWEVWAGVRESTSRRFLSDTRLQFIVFDFEDPRQMAGALSSALPEGEKWDYIIYNLGATKALTFMEFSRVNHDILRDFIQALHTAGKEPEKLLYISSLSVMGKGDERTMRPFSEKDIPNPDTAYGLSKLKAELLLESSGIPYIIFRCTGIYGPHERDYFLMFKSIDTGVDFSVGMRRQMLTFIYVEDLAQAVCQALEKAPAGSKYLISEPRGYTQREFRSIAAKALGRKFVLPLKAPICLLWAVCKVGGLIGRLKGRPLTLNPDKYRILKQRNWLVDTSLAHRDWGFAPSTNLEQGVEKTIAWYRQAGWLKTTNKKDKQ